MELKYLVVSRLYAFVPYSSELAEAERLLVYYDQNRDNCKQILVSLVLCFFSSCAVIELDGSTAFVEFFSISLHCLI